MNEIGVNNESNKLKWSRLKLRRKFQAKPIVLQPTAVSCKRRWFFAFLFLLVFWF